MKTAVTGSTDFTRRVLLAVQRNASLDVKELMATYELTAYPLSLFDDYGELRVISKSALLNLLKPLNPNTTSITCKTPSYQVLIQDGLALLLMFPISGLKTFKDLCSAFFEMISRKSAGFQ